MTRAVKGRRYYPGLFFLFTFFISCATYPKPKVEIPPAPPVEKKAEEKPNLADQKRMKIKNLARNILVRLEGLNRDIFQLEKIKLVVWFPYDDGTKKISRCGKSFYRDLYAYITSQFDPRYIKIVDREDFEKTLEEIDFQRQIYFDVNTVVEIGRKLGANIGLIGRVRKTRVEVEFFPKFIDIATSEVLPGVEPVQIPMDYALKKACEDQVDLRVQFRALRYNPVSRRSEYLKEGDVLRDYDRIKLEITPNLKCYLYIINLDSEDHAFRLFPNKSNIPISNPIASFETILLPGKRRSFLIDSTKGIEYIYVFASLQPDRELELLMEGMYTPGVEPPRERVEQNRRTTQDFKGLIRRRGLERIVEDASFTSTGDYRDVLEKKFHEVQAAKKYIFPHL